MWVALDLGSGGRCVLALARTQRGGHRTHVGLRLPGAHATDAIHFVLLCRDARGAVRLGAAALAAQAQEPAPVSTKDLLPQPSARSRAGRSGPADVPLWRLAVFLVPCVSAGQHPDVLAVHLPR